MAYRQVAPMMPGLPHGLRGVLVPVEAPHEIVEVGEDLVRAEVQFGEVARGDAQSAHGGGGMHPMADDIPDDQGDTGAGEGNDIEPVPADPRLGRHIAGGDLDGALLGEAVRQQAALQRQDHGVFTGITAGVVNADGRARGEFLSQRPVVVPEGRRIRRAVEARHAQGDPTGEEGDGDEGVDVVVEEVLGVPGILGDPPRGGPQVGLQDRLPGGQTADLGRGRAEIDRFAYRVEGAVVANAVDHRAVESGARVGRLLTAQHRRGQVDGDEVGQARHGHLGQLLGGTAHVQGGADAGTGLGQQLQTAPGRHRVRPHPRLAHHHQPTGRTAGCGASRGAGHTGSAGSAGPAGCRDRPAGCGIGKAPGQGVAGARTCSVRGRAGVPASAGTATRWWAEGRTASMTIPSTPEALVTGRLSRVTHAAAGQGHLDGGPLGRGDQFGGLLLEDHLVPPVQTALGELAQLPVAARPAARRVAPGVEVRLQQGPLPRRTLLQQPPFDDAAAALRITVFSAVSASVSGKPRQRTPSMRPLSRSRTGMAAQALDCERSAKCSAP